MLKAYQEDISKIVHGNARPCGDRTLSGQPALRGTFQSITGRKYTFTQQDAPKFMADRGELTSFSPTQMKNYPIQGFSTGDVVPHMIGEVSRLIYSSQVLRGSLLPINTIHDSILFDCETHILHRACPFLKNVLENTPKVIENYFKIPFDLPLNVDIEVGPNWGEMKKWST